LLLYDNRDGQRVGFHPHLRGHPCCASFDLAPASSRRSPVQAPKLRPVWPAPVADPYDSAQASAGLSTPFSGARRGACSPPLSGRA
jgi:hypothetical protein